PAVANKIKKAELRLKKEEKEAYLDPEKAKAAKDEGNKLFQDKNFPGSIEKYTEAIKRDPGNAVYHGNRATAYMKMMDFG
ncbi:hypothetical protein GUF49_16215, partial [Xanthomonas citri pv. citri]|nr:hypothetical protein [Xanthomonas citri pv. citri]